MKYAFYISGKSQRMFKFLEQADESIIKKIHVIVSDDEIESELKERLVEKHIPCQVFRYANLPGRENKEKNRTLSDLILQSLLEAQIDYCFSFGSHLLSGKLLDIYRWKLINFHPAILPMYPGRKAIDQAVEQGNTFLVGNTAHFIDEGMDTGKIIMQSVIPLEAFTIQNNDYDVVLDLQIEMLNQLIRIIEESRLQVQNGKVHIQGANYTNSKIFPEI